MLAELAERAGKLDGAGAALVDLAREVIRKLTPIGSLNLIFALALYFGLSVATAREIMLRFLAGLAQAFGCSVPAWELPADSLRFEQVTLVVFFGVCLIAVGIFREPLSTRSRR